VAARPTPRRRASLRGQLEGKFAEPVPPRLRIANIQVARRATMMRRLRAVAAGVLIFAVGAGAGWFAADHETVASVSVPPATTGVAQNATAAYRTIVVEVASAQEGHLLQWLSRRLGKPLVAPDLTPFGYKLMGGRLLPGNGSAAAQLMYDDASGKRPTLMFVPPKAARRPSASSARAMRRLSPGSTRASASRCRRPSRVSS